MIRIEITEEARQDLTEAVAFYEAQEIGGSEYSSTSLKGDIASLRVTAGIRRETAGFDRMLSRLIPSVIYTIVSPETSWPSLPLSTPTEIRSGSKIA